MAIQKLGDEQQKRFKSVLTFSTEMWNSTPAVVALEDSGWDNSYNTNQYLLDIVDMWQAFYAQKRFIKEKEGLFKLEYITEFAEHHLHHEVSKVKKYRSRDTCAHAHTHTDGRRKAGTAGEWEIWRGCCVRWVLRLPDCGLFPFLFLWLSSPAGACWLFPTGAS